MLKHQLTIPQWLELPQEIKQKLILLFAIPRSSGESTVNNTVISDGHTHEDLAHITVDKMRVFLGIENEKDGFWELMEMTLKRVYAIQGQELKGRIEEAQTEKSKLEESKAEALGELARQMQEIAQGAETVIAKRRGRPKKS